VAQIGESESERDLRQLFVGLNERAGDTVHTNPLTIPASASNRTHAETRD
jgi:hypothetical protein